MLKFLHSIFSNSFISTFFSGFGTALIQWLTSKFHKNKSTSVENNVKSQDNKPELSPIQKDISAIQKSIQSDLSSRKEEIYYRYFNKYKNKFSTDDISNLNKQSSEIFPNYNILLSELLGLIESIEE